MSRHRIFSISLSAFPYVLIFAALWAASDWNYLVFHTAAELAGISVAVAAYTFAWNVRRNMGNDFLLFVAMSSFAVAGIDLMHTLAFKGMGVFPGATTDLPTQLWIAGRYIQALCMLAAPLFLTRKLPVPAAVVALFVAAGGVLVWIFRPPHWIPPFPVCHDGALTPFKIVSEYVVIGIFLAATVFLWHRRRRLDREVFLFITGFFLITTMAEFAFTDYVSVYGPANRVGHLFRLIAVFLFYKALVQAGLRRPFDVLFRDLKRARDDLEHQVEERTAQLKQRARQLARLASEITLVEQRERRRIAAVLHDDLQQLLAAANIQIEVFRNSRGSHPEELGQIHRIIQEAIEASRSLSHELSPAILQGKGILEACRWLVRWMAEKHRLEVTLDSGEDVVVEHEDRRILIFQSMRELLFNVVKHSGVAQADLAVKKRNGDLTITISDRGVGFDPYRLQDHVGGGTGGMGLFSIRERLGYLEGRLEVESAPGRGARFSVVIPVKNLKTDPIEPDSPSKF